MLFHQHAMSSACNVINMLFHQFYAWSTFCFLTLLLHLLSFKSTLFSTTCGFVNFMLHQLYVSSTLCFINFIFINLQFYQTLASSICWFINLRTLYWLCWQNGKLTKWQVNGTSSWQNGMLTEHQVDETANLQNWQVDKKLLYHGGTMEQHT